MIYTKNMRKLDLLDRKLLCELDRNGRLPVSHLARRLHTNRDTIIYRMKQMEKEGVITHYTITTNPYKIGFTIYKTYLQIENNQARRKELVKFLQQHPRIYWIAESYGNWDILFSAFAQNSLEFQQIQNDIFSQFTDIIIRFNVYTLVEVWFYHKKYLVDKGTDFFFFGGKPEKISLDAIDRKLLTILSQEGRGSIVVIAGKVRSTPIMIRHRLKKLEQSGLIVGYRAEIDLGSIGMMLFKVQLHLRSFDQALERQFHEFCRQHQQVTYYIKQIGDCILELEVEMENILQFHAFLDEISEKFATFIRSVDSLVIIKQYFKWIPQENQN